MQLSHKCRLLPEDSLCNRKGHYCNERTLESVLLGVCMQMQHMSKSIPEQLDLLFNFAIVWVHGSKANKNNSDLCYCNSTIARVLNTKGKHDNK